MLLAKHNVHITNNNPHNNIHFGRADHPEPVRYIVEGPAHVGEILVVNNMDADFLISEINIASKPDTYIIKKNINDIIIQQGRIIIKGERIP